MKQSAIYLVEFLFVDFAAIAWAAWEYWSIRPNKPDPPAKGDRSAADPSGSPEGPGHPER